MTEKKKVELVFVPGCFDDFEGSQEDLDELLAEIQRMVDTGEIFEKSRPLTEESFEELDEETQIRLMEAYDSVESEEAPQRKLH